MMVKIMQEKHDGSIETLLPLDELSTEDLQGIAHFVVDPERVQLLIDLTTISLGVMTMTPEEDGEPETEPRPRAWAAKKAAIRDRLIAARDQGVTAAQLVTASEQKISDGEIYAILNAAKADMDTYRRLEAALEALGR
jgi:hypothetical protein